MAKPSQPKVSILQPPGTTETWLDGFVGANLQQRNRIWLGGRHETEADGSDKATLLLLAIFVSQKIDTHVRLYKMFYISFMYLIIYIYAYDS